jgi:hypothetical protein
MRRPNDNTKINHCIFASSVGSVDGVSLSSSNYIFLVYEFVIKIISGLTGKWMIHNFVAKHYKTAS